MSWDQLPQEHLRDRYEARFETDRSKGWPTTRVELVDRATGRVVFAFDRGYSMCPFDVFQQPAGPGGGIRHYALISHDYTRTSVVDLQAGEIVAEEEVAYYDEAKKLSGAGFCPVEFFVPDWWDVHDASVGPDSKYWDEYRVAPSGQFGFVAGCHWGDDSSWKIQYLDLSQVADGVLRREERFGYIELPPNVLLKDAVAYDPDWPGVHIAVDISFNLDTGKPSEWTLEQLCRDRTPKPSA